MPLYLQPAVTLGPLTEECAPRMLAWMQDPEVSGSIGLTREPTLERTLAWLESARFGADISGWAILVNGGRHVGNVVLDRFDPQAQTARLSIYIGEPDQRGRGIGKTAVYRALEHAFLERGLSKVWLTVHTENTRAVQAYLKVGFQPEGVLRDAFLLGARRIDGVYMGILASDFLALRVEQTVAAQ